MTRQGFALFGVSLTAVVILGCTAQPTDPGNVDATDRNRKAEADKLLVVDCLLPGQIRKLGSSLTYLAPRRPVRTTALDCEIRGGEYAAYDRADYRTALKVWLDSAREGKAEAQVYVGEIYEKGLGTEPNYGLAATWYRKAAEQGDTRGAINLGYLYEKGLGVDKDMVEALTWYRKASGLEDDDLQFASSIQAQTEHALGQLRAELSQSQSETAALHTQLRQTRQQLLRNQSELDASEQKLEELHRELDARGKSLGEQAGSVASTPTPGESRDSPALAYTRALEHEISRREAEAREQRQRILALQTELASNETDLTRLQASQRTAIAEGPSIELLDPPITLTRGIPTVRLRAVTRERFIVGKVKAPSGLATLTVNDHLEQPDTFGIFQSPVSISGQQTPVSIVAIDKQGQRAAVNFRLIPKTGAGPAAAAARPLAPPGLHGPLSVDFGDYHALIIGNNRYTNFPPLATAINDAHATDRMLREKYGFQTRLLIDADRYAILSALNDMRDKLTRKDNLLVYYAGHGELDRINELGYWLPIDAEQNNRANWISNIDIAAIINTIEAHHVLVVADSCYSGAMTRSSLARLESDLPPNKQLKWFRVMAKTRSRTVLTSGGLEPVLDSGGGEHSVFANAFLQTLLNNASVLEGYRVYREVSDQVARSAAKLGIDQEPEYAPIRHGGHEAGEFFFVPKDLRT